MAAKAKALVGMTYAIGGIMDDTHLAVSVPPKIAIAKFVGEAKGNSSHFINQIVKPNFEFYWQDEYSMLSFGGKNLPALARYIQNQKSHHAGGNLIAAMEKI